jgi:hypothetical protein
MHAYWAQWNHAEIMSMHGVEKSDYHDDDYNDDQDDSEEKAEEHCCSACMYCLGLSW